MCLRVRVCARVTCLPNPVAQRGQKITLRQVETLTKYSDSALAQSGLCQSGHANTPIARRSAQLYPQNRPVRGGGGRGEGGGVGLLATHDGANRGAKNGRIAAIFLSKTRANEGFSASSGCEGAKLSSGHLASVGPFGASLRFAQSFLYLPHTFASSHILHRTSCFLDMQKLWLQWRGERGEKIFIHSCRN